MAGLRRRARGEGRFEQLPSGLWRNVVRTGGRTISGKAATTKAEARANTLQRLEDERKGRGLADAQSFTTYARLWVKRIRNLSPTTLETYGYWIDKIESQSLGKMLIPAITDRDLRIWKGSLDLANSTLRNRCRFVNQILADAGSDARVEVPPKKEHSRRPLRPKELAELATALANADAKTVLAVMLCWQVGLRRSEACGLRHEDRDGDGVLLRRVVLLTKGKLHVRHKGKSEKSLAWVPLPPHLRDVIGSGHGYVLGDQKTPANPRVVYDDMKRLLQGTSLADVRYMAFHALRRTYGRMLLESGADVVTAAKAMRHDPAMLLNEYAKTREDLMLDAVNKAFQPQVAPNGAPREEPQTG